MQYAVEQALLERVAANRRPRWPGHRDGLRDRRRAGDGLGRASTTTASYEITTGNYAAVDAYEPGSVGKVITIAGALNERTVTPETEFLVPWRKQYTKAATT